MAICNIIDDPGRTLGLSPLHVVPVPVFTEHARANQLAPQVGRVLLSISSQVKRSLVSVLVWPRSRGRSPVLAAGARPEQGEPSGGAVGALPRSGGVGPCTHVPP